MNNEQSVDQTCVVGVLCTQRAKCLLAAASANSREICGRLQAATSTQQEAASAGEFCACDKRVAAHRCCMRFLCANKGSEPDCMPRHIAAAQVGFRSRHQHKIEAAACAAVLPAFLPSFPPPPEPHGRQAFACSRASTTLAGSLQGLVSTLVMRHKNRPANNSPEAPEPHQGMKLPWPLKLVIEARCDGVRKEELATAGRASGGKTGWRTAAKLSSRTMVRRKALSISLSVEGTPGEQKTLQRRVFVKITQGTPSLVRLQSEESGRVVTPPEGTTAGLKFEGHTTSIIPFIKMLGAAKMALFTNFPGAPCTRNGNRLP
eukprot:jgi/Bigna1/72952/fgenesh1_pg.22_\